MQTIITKITPWVVIGATAIILAVPLFVTHSTMYPFIFSKIIAFRIIVAIVLAVAFIYLLSKRFPLRIRREPLMIALLIFFAVQIITSLFGTDFSRSFWSTQERMTGLFTMVHLIAWFMLMVAFIRTVRQWNMLLAFSLGVSLIIAAYAFIGPNGGQIFSTLGNPIYLSVYAMIHVFLGAILFSLSKKQIGLQFFGACATIVNLIIMILAGGRGVILAFAVSTALFLLALVFFLPKKTRIASLGVLGIMAAFCAGLLWYGTTPQGTAWAETSLPYSIKRIVLLKQYWNPENRTEVWRIGIEGFKERPLLGWGWENFSYVFQKYYTKPIPGEGFTYFDRSHNQVIDIIVLTGILGLVAFLALWGAIFWTLASILRTKKSKREKIAILLIGSLFLAYFLQNLTVFDTPAPLIMFTFILAFTAVFCRSEENIVGHYEEARHLSTIRTVQLVGASLLLLITIVYWNVLPFFNSSFIVKGVRSAQTDMDKALKWFKKGSSGNDFVAIEGRQQMTRAIGLSLNASKLSESEKQEAVSYAIGEMRKNIAIHPLDVRHYYALSALYRVQGEWDKSALERAEGELKIARALAPLRPETFAESLQLAAQKKDEDAMREWASKAAGHLGQGEIDTQMGMLYLRLERFSQMAESFKSAIANGGNPFDNQTVMPYIAKKIPSEEITDNILNLAEIGIASLPSSGDVLAARIILNYRAGNKEIAQNYLDQARELNAPFAQSVEDYLKTLP